MDVGVYRFTQNEVTQALSSLNGTILNNDKATLSLIKRRAYKN